MINPIVPTDKKKNLYPLSQPPQTTHLETTNLLTSFVAKLSFAPNPMQLSHRLKLSSVYPLLSSLDSHLHIKSNKSLFKRQPCTKAEQVNVLSIYVFLVYASLVLASCLQLIKNPFTNHTKARGKNTLTDSSSWFVWVIMHHVFVMLIKN